MKEYTEQEIANFTENIVVLDFFAEWCGPCKILGNTLSEVESEFPKIKFAKVNVDIEANFTARYGIKGVPTLIVLKDGNEVNRIVGARSAEELKTVFSSL